MWSAKRNGDRIVQTIRDAGTCFSWNRVKHQKCQTQNRTSRRRSLGCFRRCHQRTSSAIEPGTYASQIRYPSIWTSLSWRPCHSFAPTCLWSLQCRFRWRPNGRSRTIERRSASRSTYADVSSPKHFESKRRKTSCNTISGYGPRELLLDDGRRRPWRGRHDLPWHGRSSYGMAQWLRAFTHTDRHQSKHFRGQTIHVWTKTTFDGNNSG